MSERTSGKGNTDAPRVEENEVRSGDGHRNQKRGSTQGMSYELSHGYGRTSWTSVIFGWLAALGAGLILSGIIGGVVGGILGALVHLQERFWAMSCSAAYELAERTTRSLVNAHKASLSIAQNVS